MFVAGVSTSPIEPGVADCFEEVWLGTCCGSRLKLGSSWSFLGRSLVGIVRRQLVMLIIDLGF